MIIGHRDGSFLAFRAVVILFSIIVATAFGATVCASSGFHDSEKLLELKLNSGSLAVDELPTARIERGGCFDGGGCSNSGSGHLSVQDNCIAE